MKYFFLMALLATGAATLTHAQSNPPLSRVVRTNKADATFNLGSDLVNHRHTAFLDNGNRMIIEMQRIDQYRDLPDLESLLTDMLSNISFVRDSVSRCMQCNYRLDYRVGSDGVKSYRLRRYEPQGAFLYQKGMSAPKPFKPEADTLQILIRSKDTGIAGIYSFFDRGLQVRFILNRLANLDTLLTQSGRLNAIVDTMKVASLPRRRFEKKHPYQHRTNVSVYRGWPDSTKLRVMAVPYLTRYNADGSSTYTIENALVPQVHIGAGFLRDRLGPTAGIGLFYRFPGSRSSEQKTVLGLYASGYFGFGKGEGGKMTVHDNYFINMEIGTDGRSVIADDFETLRTTIGLGYLISGKGPYFPGTTMKTFMNVRLPQGLTISPEIIFTDNFRQVFPGITLKFL